MFQPLMLIVGRESVALPLNQLAVFAARSGNAQLLRDRIAAGADVNYSNGEALKVAAAAGQVESIEILTQNGADVNIDPTG